jgi:hypothetical protein
MSLPSDRVTSFPTKTLYTPLLSSPPYMLHGPPILFFSFLSLEQYWVRNTDHSHYVVFFTSLWPHPS